MAENLASKYRPQEFEDVTEQGIVVDIVKNICKSGYLSNRNFLFTGSAGCGKAQPLYSKVLTPYGFKTMGDIEVGDLVVTHLGGIGEVVGIFPQGERPIYRITLKDGSSLCVADNHLNIIEYEDTEYGCTRSGTVTTDYLISQYQSGKYSIPTATDIEFILRAVGLVDEHRHSLDRQIVNIEYIGQDECQCIYINHPDHTYISDDFIPTHNTTLARIIAKELNNSLDECIELDAASHSGVDAIRDIINQARSYPVGSNYKVFIIDECFHRDSTVSCIDGPKKICEVEPGDTVFGLSGQAKVLNRFENTVPVTNLVLVHLNGKDILTTHDHLFMTKYGWVKAGELQRGDVVYADGSETLCDMREGVRELCIGQSESMQQGMRRNTSETESSKIPSELSENWLHEIVSHLREGILHAQERERIDLFNEVCRCIQDAARTFGKATSYYAEAQILIHMSRMWEGNVGSELGAQEVLFTKMPRCMETSTVGEEEIRVLECLRSLWSEVSSELSWDQDMLNEVQKYADKAYAERQKITGKLDSNEAEQSNVQSRDSGEDDSYEKEKWYVAYATCYTWWKWFLYQTADAPLPKFRNEVDIRISCEDSHQEAGQSKSLSYKLQSRPRTSGHSASDRSGWCGAQYEIAQIARSEERGVFDQLRVEGIEIYQPGNNDESFTSYFDDTELRSGYVTMYDLEIDGHPSYFVNNVLVHNCHAISPQSWGVLLKTLEEQPARSIFILCTTNPEKIPDTIISRVQTFQLSKISLQGIFNRLKYIIESENSEGRHITYEESALLYVAKLAQGGMRDAITLLDKCLAYSEDITLEGIEKSLGLPNYDDYFQLLGAITKKDNTTIVNIINKVYNSGVNFVKWFEGFFGFVTNIVKYIYMQDIDSTMIPSTYLDRIKGYGLAHSAVCLRLSNRLVDMNSELKTTQYLQEVAISYLCTPPATNKGGK